METSSAVNLKLPGISQSAAAIPAALALPLPAAGGDHPDGPAGEENPSGSGSDRLNANLCNETGSEPAGPVLLQQF